MGGNQKMRRKTNEYAHLGKMDRLVFEVPRVRLCLRPSISLLETQVHPLNATQYMMSTPNLANTLSNRCIFSINIFFTLETYLPLLQCLNISLSQSQQCSCQKVHIELFIDEMG
jgi:hypothetical protein